MSYVLEPDGELSDLDLEESEDESDPLFEPAEEKHDGRCEESDGEYDLPLSRIAKSLLNPESSLVIPIAFFQEFFDSVMISGLVEETNRYALQQKRLELKSTCNEMEQFLGIFLLMDIVKLPHIRALAGASGIVYDFEVYRRKGTTIRSDLGFGADMMLRLVEYLPKNQNFKIFFDNFYSSFHLVENLQLMGIESFGTVRIERMWKAKLWKQTKNEKGGKGIG
ncbi:hypothetical protein QYM36_017998 [Artemia franciscana]|uniref:PiggyBac transposable element-derived protein domain-containing protein n=1 Tax=Artemia franciscana TaxID=6661 RepID=A0AA88HE21_ARTSF|nr:hypothetical protein QYM36_017998 [Artemia franciscana]